MTNKKRKYCTVKPAKSQRRAALVVKLGPGHSQLMVDSVAALEPDSSQENITA